MYRTFHVLVLLATWSLTTGQVYRMGYYCDFESGDCGLRNVSFSGAFFKLRHVALGGRSTQCLVLDDLPAYSNWTHGATRSATVSTPVVFPNQAPLNVSLDYYMTKGYCVDYLEISQQYGNVTLPLHRIKVPSTTWTTLTAELRNPGQPVKVVVTVKLQPSCQNYLSCACANTLAIDNLRIVSTYSPTEQQRHGGGHHPFYYWWQYYHHWIKKLKKLWPPQTPPCPIYERCNTTQVVYVPCPRIRQPVIDCPPPPPVPPCPPCPTAPHTPHCPPIVCPPIRPCPPIEPCFPEPPLPGKSDADHGLPHWDPYHRTRIQ